MIVVFSHDGSERKDSATLRIKIMSVWTHINKKKKKKIEVAAWPPPCQLISFWCYVFFFFILRFAKDSRL